ncbi:MAG: hypothetical protein ACYDBV_14295 [Nitrospiria bacterium]
MKWVDQNEIENEMDPYRKFILTLLMQADEEMTKIETKRKLWREKKRRYRARKKVA